MPYILQINTSLRFPTAAQAVAAMGALTDMADNDLNVVSSNFHLSREDSPGDPHYTGLIGNNVAALTQSASTTTLAPDDNPETGAEPAAETPSPAPATRKRSAPKPAPEVLAPTPDKEPVSEPVAEAAAAAPPPAPTTTVTPNQAAAAVDTEVTIQWLQASVNKVLTANPTGRTKVRDLVTEFGGTCMSDIPAANRTSFILAVNKAFP
jgi:hypothetical protein